MSGAIAALDAVPDGGAIVVGLPDRRTLLLARKGAEVFAYENECPHSYYTLEQADGSVLVQEARYIVCSGHGASFDLTTGACAGGPCNGEPLRAVAVLVRDGAVFLA